MADLPTWEQRVRAPALIAASLTGPPISWARAQSDRGVLLANPSGRTEVFAFDASTIPATLTQLTDREQGTTGAAVSPDGEVAFWFDDLAGDELGRWQRTTSTASTGSTASTPGGGTVTLLPGLPRAYAGGIVALADGRTVLGRLLDATDSGVGFELAVARPDGEGDVVYRCADPATVTDVSHDGVLALLEFAPGGDWLHPGLRLVRIDDGRLASELVDQGQGLTAVGFHPSDAGLVLLGHERADTAGAAIWDVAGGEQHDVVTTLSGDVSASWYPGGEALLLTELREASHRLFRFDRASRELTPLPLPAGTVAESSARPDGSVHALISRSDLPVALICCADGRSTPVVELAGPPPAPTVPAVGLRVDGPGGPVPALVYLPAGATGPVPAVFLAHGGPTAQDLDAWNDRVASLVDAGYAVVRVNYRGSTGYGAAWRDALHGRLGFIELEDIGAVRDHLETTGVIDPQRVAMVGGSWGGFLTLMAVGTQPLRWRSGVALVPLADQFVAAQDSASFMRTYDAALMGGSIEEIPDAYRAASPITYADDVVAPLFISAGENDPRCPVRQVDTYVQRLRARGHPVRYDRRPTGHALPDLDMKVAELAQVLDFLAETMPVT